MSKNNSKEINVKIEIIFFGFAKLCLYISLNSIGNAYGFNYIIWIYFHCMIVINISSSGIKIVGTV
jgi:hypothetical protein